MREKPKSTKVRINKFISQSGICSRREADKLIKKGVVNVKGEKSLTLLGSLFVIYAHYKNHQICKELNCDCHNLESS